MVIASFILALASSIAAIVLSILVYRMHCNIKGHVKNLKKAFDSFEKLINGDIVTVDKKIEDHTKDHEAWQRSVLEEFGKKFAAQHLLNEQAVQKVSDAVGIIAGSRKTIAEAFRDFVKLIHHAVKDERTALEKAGGSGAASTEKTKREEAPLFNQPTESPDEQKKDGEKAP